MPGNGVEKSSSHTDQLWDCWRSSPSGPCQPHPVPPSSSSILLLGPSLSCLGPRCPQALASAWAAPSSLLAPGAVLVSHKASLPFLETTA